MFQIGDTVGDYQVTGIIGRGGMGRVYRVRSLLTDREEAMKVILDDDPMLADRFLREIRVHASLQHPNIATLHTAFRIGDRVMMIMELVDGFSLDESLKQGALPVPMAVHYLSQVLAALGFAHERGVIHRDIKPANILIAAGGVVKLTDFGIARAENLQQLTGTGMAIGTLNYMSPEQIRSATADARSDIYSLGLTAYEMTTGKRPMSAATSHALMNAQLTYMPPPPAEVNPAVPRALSDATMRAIAKDPDQRFQTAFAFRDALEGPAQPASLLSDLTPKPTPASSAPAPASAPVTQPELAEIELRLSRVIGPIARRLVADAARRYTSVPEIQQALAAQIEDPKERAEFCKVNATLTSTIHSPRPEARASFEPAYLDRLAQALAVHLGPIAKVVVTRAAKNVPNADALIATLAAEISDPADRQRFLASVRSV